MRIGCGRGDLALPLPCLISSFAAWSSAFSFGRGALASAFSSLWDGGVFLVSSLSSPATIAGQATANSRWKPQRERYSVMVFSRLGISSPLEMPMVTWFFIGFITKEIGFLRHGGYMKKAPVRGFLCDI